MDDILIQKGEKLKSKINDELRQICRENNLQGFSKCKTKNDFVKFILEHNEIIEQNIQKNVQENQSFKESSDDDDGFVSSEDESGDESVDESEDDSENESNTTDDFKLINIDDKNIFFKNNLIYNKDKILIGSVIFLNDKKGHFIVRYMNCKYITSFIFVKDGENYNIVGFNNSNVKIDYFKSENITYNIGTNVLEDYYITKQQNINDFDIKFKPHRNSLLNEMFDIFKKDNDNPDNYKILYHATEEKNVESILNRGFSMATRVRNGEAYGSGLYFSDDLKYIFKYGDSNRHSNYGLSYNVQTNSNKRFIIVSNVYVNNMIDGRSNRGILPLLPNSTDKYYDTAVDNIQETKKFIKKDPTIGINILGVYEITLKDEYIDKYCKTNRKTNLSNQNIVYKRIIPNQRVIYKRIKYINQTHKDIDIYYKPKGFNVYKDDINKCKKMTKELLKDNNTLVILTEKGDEFIVGYYSNNEFLMMKIITIDPKNFVNDSFIIKM